MPAREKRPLADYNEKRDFAQTPEPKGEIGKGNKRRFVMQKHSATRLHYDLRLEHGGVLLSWAVTKGPSLNPADKRLAVRTEDHPVKYLDFQGLIPKGYGAGAMIVWDKGSWEPVGDFNAGLKKGSLKFILKGERLNGKFALVRMKPKKKQKRENWLLIKDRDDFADRDVVLTEAYTTSVLTAETVEDLRGGRSTAKDKRLKFIKPQLAEPTDEAPSGDDWLHEVKYDGYRVQVIKDGAGTRLFSRSGLDWTDKFGGLARAFSKQLEVLSIIDGEVVVFDENGESDFSALQAALKGEGGKMDFIAFDCLYAHGKDIRGETQDARKNALGRVLKPRGPIRIPDYIVGKGEAVAENACQLNLEGIISKRREAAYRSGRNTSWRKSKCVNTDDYIIGGYRKSSVRGRPFSSLLVGEASEAGLIYRGRVGSGLSSADLDELKALLEPIDTCPFIKVPGEVKRDAVWVVPNHRAQITFAEQTASGSLRHGRYQGLRLDKKVSLAPLKKPSSAKAKLGNPVEGVKISSPNKIMDTRSRVTKLELAHYYSKLAPLILEHAGGRPMSLLRCPGGADSECFFQKNHGPSISDNVGSVKITKKGGEIADYIQVTNAKGLVSLAQIGVTELHIWGARSDKTERPDRMVFDLDPDEAISFETVKAAAQEVRNLLLAAGLESYALLTGGKGIHVVVPLTRHHDWGTVKGVSKGIAVDLSSAAPGRYVAVMSKAKRKDKIFIDWLRNDKGSTSIAPYSPRNKPGCPVAVPVSWNDLKEVGAANTVLLTDSIAALPSRHVLNIAWANYRPQRLPSGLISRYET